MDVQLHCFCVEDLPKLSWIAIVDRDRLSMRVLHGRSVEIHDSWIVEGVWDDEFAEGNFHRSENFFGSGIRIDNERIYFSASSAVVDRIFYCCNRHQLLVANSLMSLLAQTGAMLDENHDYWQEATSIFQGEKNYQKEYRVIHPELKCFYQVFYENIVYADGGISFESRSKPLQKISSFDEYHEKLTGILKKISHNYQSPLRKHRIGPFTALSSGYDSTAVSALVKDIGVTTCFVSRKSNSWLPSFFKNKSDDDGSPAAKILGLDIIYLDSHKSNISAEDELLFNAANYARHANQICLREIFYHSMFSHIQKNCEAAVVFTGLSGDKVWDIHTHDRLLNEHIIRDTIDQNLSEIRLKSGLINIPVPFILIRNIRDIVNVGRSAEMAAWRINNHYDRPVARRIAETAGVKRGTFALKKKGAATTLSNRYPYNKILRKRFFRYLKKHYGINSGFVYFSHYLNQFQLFLQKALSVSGLRSKGYRQTVFWKEIDFAFYLWLWSVGEIKQKMMKVLKESNPDE